MLGQQPEKSKINKFKDLLYSRKDTFTDYQRRQLREKDKDKNLKEQWENKDDVFDRPRGDNLYNIKTKTSPTFIIILIASIIFFVGAISYAFFYLTLNQGEVKQKIDMSIIGPNTAGSGSDFKFVVKLENNTEVDFENISLLIVYPDSTINAISGGVTKNDSRERPEKLLSGGRLNEQFNIILSGIAGDQRDIEVSLLYNAVGFSNVISDTKIYQLGIDSAPISLEIEYPERVLSEKMFEIEIDALSNTNVNLKELLLVADLPQGFSVEEFSPEPFFRNTTTAIFKIENLAPGGKTKIKIKGSLSGQHEEEKIFSFEMGDTDPLKDDIRTLFAKIDKEIIIKRPDLQLEIAVNGEYGEEHIIQAGEVVKINLGLRNNLDSVVNDLRIEAQIEGENFDPQELEINNGYYDSNQDNIIWEKNTWSALQTLNGREKIDDTFSIRVKDLLELAGYQTNPILKLDFKVRGTSFDSTDSVGDVVSEDSILIKTATHLVLESDAVYSIGPFENNGPTSPTVGDETTYTVVWRLSNSTNLLENIEVKGKLPIYVKFLDNISPEQYYVEFIEETREVVWRIKKIEPYIGHRTPPKTVYFQVSVTPSANQVGSVLDLVGPKTVIATDTFIETQISSKQNTGDTSEIKNDPITKYNIGNVRAAE